jgi:hypothetical protein
MNWFYSRSTTWNVEKREYCNGTVSRRAVAFVAQDEKGRLRPGILPLLPGWSPLTV